MHKEESDSKINEKNNTEKNILNSKTKLTKEKKISQKNSVTPKKAKKKVQFFNTKEKEKDTNQKSNIIKAKVPPLVEEKKNDKIEKTQENNTEHKNNIEEVQNTSPNLKENKEKRNWKSWSPQEKILFYEIIANGGNYSSLQKLFKTMNDVSISLKN